VKVGLHNVAYYVSQYPTQDDDHVKSTTKYDTSYWAYYATDPTKSLTGSFANNSWLKLDNAAPSRFHIDLGSAKIITRIYYENNHHFADPGSSAKNFTFWGSNTAGAFTELTYTTDTNWTQLTTSQSTFDQHSAVDAADPKYITVTNTTAYRYYAVKIADSYEYDYCGLRRIELQTLVDTTTELTPTINIADTFQEVKINLQNITNANKNAIDQITVTPVNADEANTFYLDNMLGYYIPQSIVIG
jgi:hypothetical protein